MHDHEPCGVETCPAIAVTARGFCSVHEGARRAKHVIAGTRCPACSRVVKSDEWITEASTASEMTHVRGPNDAS